MNEHTKKINWPLILVYLLMTGGFIALTVFLAEDLWMPVALAITALFGMMGLTSFVFQHTEGGRGWRYVTWLNWVAALIALTVFLVEDLYLPVSLALATLFFLSAGLLFYVVYRRKDADARPLKNRNNRRIKWRQLGDYDPELSPPERDVPMPHQGV